MAKMPGIISPCTKRQKMSACRPGDVAARRVGTARATIDQTITSLRLRRSAKAPKKGAESATPSVDALIVSPTAAFEALKMCERRGSNGCVAYRSIKAKIPHRQTAATLESGPSPDAGSDLVSGASGSGKDCCPSEEFAIFQPK